MKSVPVNVRLDVVPVVTGFGEMLVTFGALTTVTFTVSLPPSGLVSVKVTVPPLVGAVSRTDAAVVEVTVALVVEPPLVVIAAPVWKLVPARFTSVCTPPLTDVGATEVMSGAGLTVNEVVARPPSGFVTASVYAPGVPAVNGT